jgi:hypothetical protein
VRASGGRRRRAPAAATAASLVLLGLYFQSHYGSPSFRVALGPSDVAAERIPWGLTGDFFDRQYGLLPVAPALALAIPGAVILWRRRTGDALRAAVLALLVALPAAAYIGWWGGAAPPARYVLPLVGPLFLGVAMTLPSSRDALAALGGMGLVVLGLAADAPRMLRNRPDGESLFLRMLSPEVDLNAWLPSFLEPGWRAPVLALSLVAALAIAWRWRGRGLVAAAIAYALMANGLRERPLIDQGQATQRLLAVWEGGDARGLTVPFDLPRQPWTLDPGEARNSRRINVPPGAYRLMIRAHAREAPAMTHVEAFAGELVVATADAGGDAAVPVLLPLGGRGLAVSASGVAGRAEIDSVALVAEDVVPAERREPLEWPSAPLPGRYRLDVNGVRVTLLTRNVEPDGDGFRVRGAGRFLLEAPAGARIRQTRQDAGAIEAREEHLDTSAAVVVGRVALLPVAMSAADARVTFAIEGR